VFRDNLPVAESKIDFVDVIRGYWYEWGMSEGASRENQLHRAADAWLQGLSLADHLKAPISAERAKFSFAGLGVAFGKVAETRPDCPYARARRAVAYLGRLTTSDPRALDYFNKYDYAADKASTPNPKDIDEAIDWLTVGVTKAGSEIQDPFLSKRCSSRSRCLSTCSGTCSSPGSLLLGDRGALRISARRRPEWFQTARLQRINPRERPHSTTFSA
jgi:hypothetical protein